jgi:hypothetical protein
MLSRRRWAFWLLALGQVLLALGLLRQWLYLGTYRLYVPDRTGSARQRFDLRDGRVEPQILATGDDKLSFPLDSELPSRLRLRAVPGSRATLTIALVEPGARRTLYHRTLSEAAEIAQPLPPTRGLLEMAMQGELRLSDPRVVQEPVATPRLLGLLALGLLMAWWNAWARVPVLPRTPWARTALLGAVTAAVGSGLALGALEVGLRALGDRLPSWVMLQRRNLGEAHADPRWQDSPSYGPRLAPGVHAVCEWQHGDIVRMGFMAPGLARHPAYRFPLVTDAEGFRNSEPQASSPEVAALGDSFTDALTLPAELTWPRRLAGLLGASVRNYGTAGFGPGQELLVLKEYVLARRPRLVVVGFFAGNDLQDAERFEGFQREGVFPASGLGWKFKPVIARFDEPYVTSLYEGLLSLRERSGPVPRAASDDAPESYNGDDPAAPASPGPSFDRGLFTVPVAGRALRLAFLPPYLNCLQYPREDLEASHRWQLTLRSYREMARLVRSQGGELVVMLIPSKAQVYLPLLEERFAPGELRQAVGLCLREQPYAPSLELLLRNRLALNQLMRDFCATEGVAFLDLTAELQSRAQSGHNVYFPDDSHWNAAGHETAAAALAGFVKARGFQGSFYRVHAGLEASTRSSAPTVAP